MLRGRKDRMTFLCQDVDDPIFDIAFPRNALGHSNPRNKVLKFTRYATTNRFSREIRHADNDEYVRKFILLLFLKGTMNLVGSQCKAVVRLKANHFLRTPEY